MLNSINISSSKIKFNSSRVELKSKNINSKLVKTIVFKKKKKFSILPNKLMAICIKIKFVANNIFCTVWSISGKQTFRVHSAGMQKIHVSKRKLFFYSHTVIQYFLKELSRWWYKYKKKGAKLFYSLQIPKKYRTAILKGIYLNANAIHIVYGKPFNGCKVRKKRRKKRLRFRSFK